MITTCPACGHQYDVAGPVRVDGPERSKLGGSNVMLRMQEAADYVGISRSRFYRHYKDDWHITHYRVGNRVNFRVRDLDAYLDRVREAA